MASVDFFISYAGADRPWAEWVAFHLTAAGYRVELDVWDWRAGDNAVTRMNDALTTAGAVVALYSPAYFDARRFTLDEWTSVLAQRPDERQRLVPLRVADVRPPRILASLVWRDLFGLDEAQAREVLLSAVRDPARPSDGPVFPPTLQDVARAASPRVPGSLPQVWNVRRRNPAFTGRESVLATLRHQLCADNRALVQALHGLGGVGKTQVAVEYAHMFANEYDVVWWVDAERRELIGEQLLELGRSAGWVDETSETRVALAAIKRWLRGIGRWLLFFDNARTIDDILVWLPDGPGHVVITSRSGQTGGVAVPVEVDVFTRTESVALLQVHLPSLADADADLLAAELGDLPLALSQAAGLLAETGMTVPEYLAELTSNASNLLGEAAAADYPAPLAAVVLAAMRRLAIVDPATIELMRLLALLAPEPIPVAWFTIAPSEVLGERLATVASSRLALRRCLGRLMAYGLARVDGDSVQVHRLTQAVLRDTMAEPDDHKRAERVLASVAPTGQARDPRSWPAWAQVLPHVLALNPTQSDALLAVTGGVIRYLMLRGDYSTALQLAEAWHRHWSAHVRSDHPTALMTATTLAAAHRHAGNSEKARVLDGDTFDRRRRILGEEHPDTLGAGNNLASSLQAVGDHGRARELLENTWMRCRRVLGDDHPDTLGTANNLATSLQALGELERARRIHEDTLIRRKRVLGEGHHEVLGSANNLANTLQELGQLERARDLHQETLGRRREMLGEDHPETLRSANNLATTLQDLGDLEQARQVHQDTLRRRKRVLGEDDPSTLTSASNLGNTLLDLGHYELARQLLQDTLRRRKQVFGEDHPDTLRSADNLVVCLRAMGDLATSQDLDDATQPIRRLLLGDE